MELNGRDTLHSMVRIDLQGLGQYSYRKEFTFIKEANSSCILMEGSSTNPFTSTPSTMHMRKVHMGYEQAIQFETSKMTLYSYLSYIFAI